MAEKKEKKRKKKKKKKKNELAQSHKASPTGIANKLIELVENIQEKKLMQSIFS